MCNPCHSNNISGVYRGKIVAALFWCVLFWWISTEPGFSEHTLSDTVIDEKYAEKIFAITTTSEKKRIDEVITVLNTLDNKQLKVLRDFIQKYIDTCIFQNSDVYENNKEKIFENKRRRFLGNTAMDERYAYWLRNVIDDRLGILVYDRVIEGYIGCITAVSTVGYYAFTGTNGEHAIIAIGESTLEEDGGTIVSGYDWECYPRRVRLFLVRDSAYLPDVSFVRKVATVGEDALTRKVLPECGAARKNAPPRN